MQPLSWWVQCLVLRTLPGSLLRRADHQRSDNAYGEEEAAPLRPDRNSPLPMCGSFKPCRKGAFILVTSLTLAVLSVLAMHLFLSIWLGSNHKENWQRMFVDYIDNNSISNHLQQLTKEPHVAGTTENFKTAEYVESTFRDYGLDAHHKDFDVLLTYPLHRSLVLTQPGHETIELFLNERAVPGDPYSNNSKVMPPFHGYAPSGNASAEVVYANYGRQEDFEKLSQLGATVEGAIVIARYGMIYRGDIVENAARAGAVAVVIYSDPFDYGNNGTQGYYPDSQWLPPSGAQRGSVYRGIGDPLTPGWASESEAERLSVDDPNTMLPRIPSLPISAEDALPILRSLSGPVAPLEWQGTLELSDYKLGRGPGRLNFSYVANQTVRPIRNVFATILGSEEPDRFVLLGNHRDAWAFGAVDPNSGTAALLELARGFGKLLEQGWRPHRTIVLCSWDAEEFGLVGSTEWVEQNSDILNANAVVYMNVDCAVAGPGLNAGASPQLDDLLIETTKQVTDPDDFGQSLYDSWMVSSNKPTPSIGRLGGGDSDFASFLQHAGVPSMDIYFGADYPVYHSIYDNYNWMVKFGDPLFRRHVAITTVWGLLALRLADDAILPMKYENYANELHTYTLSIISRLKEADAPESISCTPLLSALKDLGASISKISQELKAVNQEGMGVHSGPDLGPFYRQRGLNDRLLRAERAFLDSEGIPGYSWYKHLVYGPVSNNNYGSLSFPAIWDSIYEATGSSNDASNSTKWAAVQHQIFRSARAITRASLVLRGKLT
ncbi:hypothetical protein M758_3G066300 [Ceratodon purpureus]|nr:hypothetical protein M758_3G066300 [Ceratodon purpureus]